MSQPAEAPPAAIATAPPTSVPASVFRLELQAPLGHVPALFCASHIRDKARLEMFEYMLRSVNAQQTECAPLIFWISASVSTPELQARLEAVLGAIPAAPNITRREFFPSTPLTQFQHYESLVCTFAADTSVEMLGRTWVAFVDDDDEIAPRRMDTFTKLIRSRPSALMPPFVVIDGFMPKELAVLTPEQQALVTKGYRKDKSNGEYTTLCIYFPALYSFFQHAPASLLANRFCDLYLCTYFGSGDEDGLHYSPHLAKLATAECEYIYWLRPGSDQARDDPLGRDLPSVEYRLTRYLQYDRVRGPRFDESDWRSYMLGQPARAMRCGGCWSRTYTTACSICPPMPPGWSTSCRASPTCRQQVHCCNR